MFKIAMTTKLKTYQQLLSNVKLISFTNLLINFQFFLSQFKHIHFSKRSHPYSSQHVTELVYHQKR